MRELQAVLPPAPGVNALYGYSRIGQNGTRVYRTARAEEWAQWAHLLLRAAGFRSLQDKPCWISLELIVYTTRLDIDAPLKIVLDAVQEALCMDDRYVGELHVVKIPAKPADQRLEIHAVIRPACDREAFTLLSEERALHPLPLIPANAGLTENRDDEPLTQG